VPFFEMKLHFKVIGGIRSKGKSGNDWPAFFGCNFSKTSAEKSKITLRTRLGKGFV